MEAGVGDGELLLQTRQGGTAHAYVPTPWPRAWQSGGLARTTSFSPVLHKGAWLDGPYLLCRERVVRRLWR